MIRIENPYVEHKGDKVRLVSLVKLNDKALEIFYEVDKEYAKYLTFERADSFLVGLLPYAIKNKEDIISESPLSNKLMYQLNNDLIPSLAKYRYHTEPITVSSEQTNNAKPLEGEAIGTGLSSGVDSFETISSHTELSNEDYNVTHAVFLNVGSHGTGQKAEKLYKQRLQLAKDVADDIGIELIHVNSNIGEFFGSDYVDIHTFLSASAILALQKLFKTYYYASGYPINEFKITKSATSANFDLLTLTSISTENLQFYTTGIEKTRLDKVKSISNFKPSYKWLNICTRTIDNCGECDKCIRTQLELDSIDKLGLYDEVFDLDKFNSNRSSHIGYALANIDSSYNREIIDAMRANKEIPVSSYFHSIKHLGKKVAKKLYRMIK